MIFPWLRELQVQLLDPRRFKLGGARKRRRSVHSQATTLVEACEARVLLSAVSVGDRSEDATTPDDIASSPDYFAVISTSPVGDDISQFEDDFSTYEDGWYESIDESFSEAVETQNDPNQTGGTGDGTAGDGGNGNDQSQGTSTSSGQTDEATDGYQSLLGQIVSGLAGGSTTDSETDDSGDTTNADSGTDDTEPGSLFEFPEHIQFTDTQLPLEALGDDLIAAMPDGQSTFENITLTSSTATAPSEGDEPGVQAELTQTITTGQEWVSDSEWTIHQSVSDSWEQGTSHGESDVPGLTGNETYSITVINGTTTIESWSKTSSYRLAEGTIPDEEIPDDDDPFAVPHSWVESSTTPVDTKSTPVDAEAGEENESDGEAADEAGIETSESGSFTSYNTGIQTTITTTEITLDDGTVALQRTFSVSWYAGFSYRDGGTLGHDVLDEENNDGGSDSSADDATVTISGSYTIYVSASIGGHFTVTTVSIKDTGAALPDEGSTSAGFALSAQAGGTLDFTTTVEVDESSGDASAGTDEKNFVSLKDTQKTAGRVGLSFWAAGSTADDEESPADDSAPENQNPEDGNADDGPKVGQQSAEEFLEENTSGIQFNFEVSGSSGTSKDHTIDIKTRTDTSVTTIQKSDVSSNDNNASFGFAAGTEDISLSLGAGGSTSANVSFHYETESWEDNGENTSDGVDDETLTVFEREDYSKVIDSSWSFEFSLGTDDGFVNENESSYFVSVASTLDLGDIFNGEKAGYKTTKVYVDYSDDVETTPDDQPLPDRENTITETFYSPDGTFVEVQDLGAPTGASGAPDSANDNGDQSPQELLDSYQSATQQLLHLQAMLNNETDPERQEWLQGLIAAQQQHVNNIAAQATAAGVTASQLSTAAQNAADNVAANPPDPIEPWEGGTTWMGIIPAVAGLALPPDFTVSLGAGGDLHMGIYHLAADLDVLQIGWDESTGNTSIGFGLSVGKGYGLGAEAGLGASLEITNQDHIDKLRGPGRLSGINTPGFGIGTTQTDPFHTTPIRGLWGSVGPTIGLSVFSIETWATGLTHNINFNF